MKKILVPLFSLIISFNAYGEWTFVVKGEPSNNNVYTHYVDFDSVKINGNIYNWQLTDYLKPEPFGDLSVKFFLKVIVTSLKRDGCFLSCITLNLWVKDQQAQQTISRLNGHTLPLTLLENSY